MNFLARAVESFTGNSIPYTLGDRIITNVSEDPLSTSIWNVYDATSDKDGLSVTVFEFDLKNPQLTKYTELARNAFKRSRSLALLPGVLNVIDSIENDTHLYIITERAKPLRKALKSNNKQNLIIGIYEICSALKFINCEGASVHCNVCQDSVYVTVAGEWKLSGFELLVNTKEKQYNVLSLAYQLPTFRSSLVPPEFERSGAAFFSSVKPNMAIKFDTYKLGCMILELLESKENAESIRDLLQDVGNVPKTMLPHLRKCIQPSVTIRYTVQQFMKFGEHSYFNTPLIRLWKSLNEMALKNDEEKQRIFESVDTLTDLPPGMLEYRVLPEMIICFNHMKDPDELTRRTAILYTILKHTDDISESTFERMVKPVIFHAFTFMDRATRMTLLNSLPTLVPRLSKSEVQNNVFPNLVKGFNDTNDTIREATIRAIIPISEKLTNRQLNNDLLRYLARLQSDTSLAIRMNVVLCLVKVADQMNSNSRVAVLVTAFGKALKDNSVRARIGALTAFKQCKDYFSAEVCCSRILSAVAPALLDKSSKVRQKADELMDQYMVKIKEAAAKIPQDEEEEEEEEENLGTGDLENGIGELKLGEGGLTENHQFKQPESVNEDNGDFEDDGFGDDGFGDDGFGDDGFEDDWGFDDSEQPELTFGSTSKPSKPSKPSGLKLGKKNKLAEEIKAEKEEAVKDTLASDEEDAWADDW